MRLLLVLFLLVFSGLVRAEWTGVAFEISDVDFDWEFNEGLREVKSNSLRLLIEERTQSGLAIGASFGYLDARIAGTATTGSTKFDAEHLEIYFRHRVPIGETFHLHGLFSYGYFNGSESGAEEPADVEWNETSVELGLGLRFDNIEIIPFLSYTDVDGDISGDEFNRDLSFELEDPVIQGVDINVYTDSTAFIGLRLQAGSQQGGYLSFVRRY